MASSLDGKRIVNTRAAAQAEALDRLLERRGAQAVLYPCVACAARGYLADGSGSPDAGAGRAELAYPH
jgi:hypothetical protein